MEKQLQSVVGLTDKALKRHYHRCWCRRPPDALHQGLQLVILRTITEVQRIAPGRNRVLSLHSGPSCVRVSAKCKLPDALATWTTNVECIQEVAGEVQTLSFADISQWEYAHTNVY